MRASPHYQPIARSGVWQNGVRWERRKGSWVGVEVRDGPASNWHPGFAVRRVRGKHRLVPITPEAVAQHDAEGAALYGMLIRKLQRERAEARMDNRSRDISRDADVDPTLEWVNAEVPELSGYVIRPMYEEVVWP